MDKVATFINHDVSVMAILYLKDVADDAIGGQTLDEVKSCESEFFRGFAAVAF